MLHGSDLQERLSAFEKAVEAIPGIPAVLCPVQSAAFSNPKVSLKSMFDSNAE